MARRTVPTRKEWSGPHHDPPRANTTIAQTNATPAKSAAAARARRAMVWEWTTRPALSAGLTAVGLQGSHPDSRARRRNMDNDRATAKAQPLPKGGRDAPNRKHDICMPRRLSRRRSPKAQEVIKIGRESVLGR